MKEEDTFEDIRNICLRTIQPYKEQESIPYFRMSEKDLISSIGITSETGGSLLKRCKISKERKKIVLRIALYGFLKKELIGATYIISKQDYRLRIPKKYIGNLERLKSDFKEYLDDKILEGRYL